MDFDAAFKLVGALGRFQVLCIVILFISNIIFGTQMLLMVIVGASPNTSIPSEENLTTIVTEWDLHDKQWVVDLIASLFMAGYIAGMLLFGQLPDLYGRKPTFILTFVLMLTCSFSSAFCKNWETFAVARFFAGMFAGVVSPVNYVFMCELIGHKYWASISMVSACFFPLGTMTLSLLGYELQDWRLICIVLSTVPLILLPLHLFILPESPRWLYSVGKLEKAEKVMTMMARRNGKTGVDIHLIAKTENSEEDLNKHTIIDLFKIPYLLKVFVMACFLWFTSALLYYGLTLDVSDLAPNLYIAIILSSTIEIPAFILVGFLLDRKIFGRRGTILPMLLLCGSAATVLIFLDMNRVTISVPKTVAGLVAKLSIAGVFACLFLYTAELFPTQLRVVALGSSSICGRLGAIAAPFVPLLSKVASYLPYTIFAASPTIAAAILLFLPETLGREIPKMPVDFGKRARERSINKDGDAYPATEDDKENLLPECNSNIPAAFT